MNASPLRLRRIVNLKSNRALLLSFTAGLEVGLIPDLADLPGLIGKLAQARYLSAAIVHVGVLPTLFSRFPALPCGIIVDLLGGTWLTPQMEHPTQICSLEQAVRAGADAVLASVSLGGPDESSRMRLCGQVARECAAWGMPLVMRIDTLAASAQKRYSAVLSGQGARMAYELGADLVIVNYSGTPATFTEALHGIDIPVLVGGGPHMETDEGLFESVTQAVQCGARGFALGAPMFWHDGQPSATLVRLASAILGPGPTPRA